MGIGFEIRKAPFSIRFRHRELYAFFDHHLMYFELTQEKALQYSDEWLAEAITIKNVDDCANEVFSCGRMKRYLLEQPDYVNGFLFREAKTGKTAGFLWIMYPGGNEFQYRVRKVDAFLFDVYVSPDFRGHGLCGQMFQYVFDYLKKNGKKTVALGVRTNNPSAIKAYKKAGGVIKARKRFIQLAHRYNIPYYSI